MNHPSQQNIELKARLADLERARTVAIELGATAAGILDQTDTYFHVAAGRLKLRESVPGDAELIAYHRADQHSTRDSRYDRLPIARPDILLWQLSSTLGVRVVVRKQRELWLMDQVRIHLDTVPDLGRFLEFEVLVGPGQDEPAAQRRAEELVRRFGIQPADVVAGSYADLLLDAGS